ncbi:hypothetical protein H2204_002981 [Knufia peltigerae]|uniref:Major facilitator superfamily (MFS) profile domain-containing protein n=1 Tax=Knufia peltigerae TaxID=1002370 RepID=A0AA38YAD4_9EURO|nr:hypothetical protein H2204_002981 [Knufia peltigerae]
MAETTATQSVNPAWPPGTISIEDFHRSTKGEIILQPKPSSDPNDPLNWPSWQKYLNLVLVSFYALLVFALLNSATVTWTPMNLELGFSYAILNDSYAVGCGTLCIGGLALIPFALKFGRRPVYILSLLVQVGMSVWSARIHNVADLMLVNLISNFVGALCEVMVQMTIVDIFFVHQRGRMNSFYVWMLNVGASLAPLAAGYVTVSEGWRWVWWWIAILLGILLLAFTFFYEETRYDRATIDGVQNTDSRDQVDPSTKGLDFQESDQKQPVLLDTVQSRGANSIITDLDTTGPRRKSYYQKLSLWSTSPIPFRYFLKHCYQPAQVLTSIPAVFYMALLQGAMTSASIISVTALSVYITLPPYSFNASQLGLMGLPGFIGILLGALICGPLSDWTIIRLSKSNKGIYEPEMRLYLILASIPFLVSGVLITGIAMDKGLAWEVIAVGTGLTGFGATAVVSMSYTYLADAYGLIIADCLVAVTFVKNLFPTIFVFALTPWIKGVGLSNVFITVAVIDAVIMLGSLIFLKWGKHFRIKTAIKYSHYARHQPDEGMAASTSVA